MVSSAIATDDHATQRSCTPTRGPACGVAWCADPRCGVSTELEASALRLAVSLEVAVSPGDALTAGPVAVWGAAPVLSVSEPVSLYPVSMTRVRDEVLGKLAYGNGGSGIDVALIDTGVAPVEGLSGNNVIHGPDLSDEGGQEGLAHIDSHGHGTFMAGIIAGSDGTADGFQGVAPESRIVSLKVAGADGAVDIAQVIAAIDWVVEHKSDADLNIRVLNLSLGVTTVSDYLYDPLSAAVERAWDAGIVVVVAAGNQGATEVDLDSPALDPYVIAVGATESEGPSDGDDLVPAWSAQGDGVRNPDVVAPGRSIISLRVPGSASDVAHPDARIGDRFARASGTSEAAAVVSGSVAALLSHEPYLTPDDVKSVLVAGAHDLAAPTSKDGFGRVRIDYSYRAQPSGLSQSYPKALIDAPGTDIAVPADSTWEGGGWEAAPAGAAWTGATWSGATWSGATWSGATWSGATWSGATWSGGTWSGGTWSGGTWSGGTWSGGTWSGFGWS